MGIWDDLAGVKPRKKRASMGRSVKQQVAQKQNWKCFSCKKKMNQYDFDVHHRDGDPSNNRITNLRALHTACHRRIERSKAKKTNRSTPKSDLDYVMKGSRKSGKSDLDYLLGKPKRTRGRKDGSIDWSQF